jgi:phosphoenolpyruvate phosphomutase
LENHGFNIVIYANQMLRASYKAMVQTANTILSCQRSLEAESEIASTSEILRLIPGTS